MAFKIFVGNLSWSATEEALRAEFEKYGAVVSVRIVTDPYTGRSKGFAFVEMSEEDACNMAIEKLENSQFMNRPLRVSRARTDGGPQGGSRPPRDRSERGGNGGGYPPRGPSSGPRGAHSGHGRGPMRSRYDEE